MYAVWKLDGISSRSGPRSLSNQRSRSATNDSVASSLAAFSAAESWCSEMP